MHRWRMPVETPPYLPLAGIMKRVVVSGGAGSVTRSEGTRVCDVEDRRATSCPGMRPLFLGVIYE
jgi:hypothetical protein